MPKVKAMIVLDNEGKRITVKYYAKDWATSVKEQSNFERSLFAKTARTNARGEGKRRKKPLPRPPPPFTEEGWGRETEREG